MPQPLMPKATAVWLIENTALTFEQIAEFCGLHELEVKGIADGEVAVGIVGIDPIANGQIQPDEIARCERDPNGRLKLIASQVPLTNQSKKKGARYTPVSKRSDRPDAIAWILKFHPEIPDAAVQKLLGTTKATIQSIRDRSHWNSQNIKPRDPVSVGICSQLELDRLVQSARARKEAREAREARALEAAAPGSGVEPPAPEAEGEDEV